MSIRRLANQGFSLHSILGTGDELDVVRDNPGAAGGDRIFDFRGRLPEQTSDRPELPGGTLRLKAPLNLARAETRTDVRVDATPRDNAAAYRVTMLERQLNDAKERMQMLNQDRTVRVRKAEEQARKALSEERALRAQMEHLIHMHAQEVADLKRDLQSAEVEARQLFDAQQNVDRLEADKVSWEKERAHMVSLETQLNTEIDRVKAELSQMQSLEDSYQRIVQDKDRQLAATAAASAAATVEKETLAQKLAIASAASADAAHEKEGIVQKLRIEAAAAAEAAHAQEALVQRLRDEAAEYANTILKQQETQAILEKAEAERHVELGELKSRLASQADALKERDEEIRRLLTTATTSNSSTPHAPPAESIQSGQIDELINLVDQMRKELAEKDARYEGLKRARATRPLLTPPPLDVSAPRSIVTLHPETSFTHSRDDRITPMKLIGSSMLPRARMPSARLMAHTCAPVSGGPQHEPKSDVSAFQTAVITDFKQMVALTLEAKGAAVRAENTQ